MKAFVVRKKRVQNVIPAGSILYWSGTLLRFLLVGPCITALKMFL